MNLLAYTWRTAPNSFVAPAILVAGIVAAIAQDELPSALVAFAFLVAVLTITIVGTMQDYQRDVLTRVERLVAWSFGNNERHGHRTPTQAEGAAYIAAAKADPFAPFTFAGNYRWAAQGDAIAAQQPRRDWTFARERRVIRQAFHALTA